MWQMQEVWDIVFEGPVLRLEKDWDWTTEPDQEQKKPEKIKTRQDQDRKKPQRDWSLWTSLCG